MSLLIRFDINKFILKRIIVIYKNCKMKQKKIQIGQFIRNVPFHSGDIFMQTQRFFVEHSIKESKQILGLDQYQTQKWTAWQHQVVMNFHVSSFFLMEKFPKFDHLQLLSARAIKGMMVYQLYQQISGKEVKDRIF